MGCWSFWDDKTYSSFCRKCKNGTTFRKKTTKNVQNGRKMLQYLTY